MTIRIVRGMLGDQSATISFLGITSEGASAASYKKEVSDFTAEVGIDTVFVRVVDNALTENNGSTTYELENTHYTEFLDSQGNSFSGAQDVVDFLNNQKTGIVTSVYNSTRVPYRVSGLPVDTVNVSVNTQFSFTASLQRAVSYYWDEATFPNGVEVSRFDRRKISGIITQTGTYNIQFEAVNRIGSYNTSVDIIVS